MDYIKINNGNCDYTKQGLIMNLNNIINSSDKFDLGYVDTFYNPLFAPIKNNVSNILEIGIQNGYSLRLWRDFFTNANIYGVDIDLVDLSLFYEDRITPIYTDAYNTSFTNTLKDAYFDIVIDDGPHTYESMVFFLQNYITKVKPGGFLILEDIVDRSWTPSLIECIEEQTNFITVYDMRGKQKTSTLAQKWDNGLDVIVVQKRK